MTKWQLSDIKLILCTSYIDTNIANESIILQQCINLHIRMHLEAKLLVVKEQRHIQSANNKLLDMQASYSAYCSSQRKSLMRIYKNGLISQWQSAFLYKVSRVSKSKEMSESHERHSFQVNKAAAHYWLKFYTQEKTLMLLIWESALFPLERFLLGTKSGQNKRGKDNNNNQSSNKMRAPPLAFCSVLQTEGIFLKRPPMSAGTSPRASPSTAACYFLCVPEMEALPQSPQTDFQSPHT